MQTLMKNVGQVDRVFRLVLGLFLIWLGLWGFGGLDGKIMDVLVACVAVLPFSMVVTQSCFVFR